MGNRNCRSTVGTPMLASAAGSRTGRRRRGWRGCSACPPTPNPNWEPVEVERVEWMLDPEMDADAHVPVHLAGFDENEVGAEYGAIGLSRASVPRALQQRGR